MKLYLRLPADDPAVAPDRAKSLINLGRSMSDLGRWDEALAATEQAVKLLRWLAAADPTAFEPDLAGDSTVLGCASGT